MKARMRRATKRKIPKMPGKSRCSFTFEVDGEIVLMKVDCAASCGGKQMRKEICWASLVRAISNTALPDRIMLCGSRAVICDRILVSLIRNAALLIRRIDTRLEELRRTNRPESLVEEKRLTDLIRAMLYDIPQLISRDFESTGSADPSNGDGKHEAKHSEFARAGEILARKKTIDLKCLATDVSDKVLG